MSFHYYWNCPKAYISGDMILTPAYGRFRCMSPVHRWPSSVHLLYTHSHQQSARQVFSLANSKNIFLPIKIIIISATFLHLAFCLRSQCFLTSLWWNSSLMKTGLVSETLSRMANDVLGICMRLLPVLLLPNYNTNIQINNYTLWNSLSKLPSNLIHTFTYGRLKR